MKQLYADIVIDILTGKLDKTFQYRIPQNMQEDMQEGSKVIIPFGNGNRKEKGYVISISDTPKIPDEKIKDIYGLCESEITPEENLVRLAVWMKKLYGSSLISALKAVLPVKQKKDVKKEKHICLKINADNLQIFADEYKRKHYKAKERLARALIENGSISWDKAVKELKIAPSVIRSFEEKNIIYIESQKTYRRAVPKGIEDKKELPKLQDDQKRIYDEITLEFGKNEPKPILLRGITGSGKTLVYMHLIKDVIDRGRQAILLIPEISLTWQTVSRFYACFGETTAVLHSKLSDGEKSDLVERIKNKEVSLVIGPRSALFVPFDDLGIIIVDEEHDSSYQSEKTPRYNAREAALKRAEIENAAVLLGSATPSLESRYRCDIGQYRLLALDRRFGSAKMPEVRIVDMRDELKEGRTSIISLTLAEEIKKRLDKKEQCLLFLNRRGYAGFFTCRSCGNVVKCPHCDVSLTLHKNGKLMCHYCGYTRPMIKLCPKCGSPYIGSFRMGTQKLEEILNKSFPEARIFRMDRDTTSKKESYEKILKGFADGKADILIGTQMIVKGHDFPRVTLVGALAADTSLYAQDYRAAETTFQLLVQAAGRAGRGDRNGLAIIQTYNPEHYAIADAKRQDYEAFYHEEIDNRAIMNYPPVSCLLVIHGTALDEGLLSNAMEHIKNYLVSIKSESTVILGPVNEQVAKIQDKYRGVIYIKNADIKETVRLRQYVEKYISINRGFNDISIQFALND